jgi:ketosteroid isomerase-like protein
MTPDVERDPELQRIVDEGAIRRVMCRYARAVDRCDWDLLRNCYHPDATDEHLPGASGSVEELIEWLKGQLEDWESTSHFLGNQLVDFDEDGDVAWVETYLSARRRSKRDGDKPAVDVSGDGRYFDRFERRDGEWRIAHRKVLFRARRVDAVPVDDGLASEAGSDSRDRNDPSYQRTVSLGGA